MKILVLIPFLLLLFFSATAQQPYAWQLTDEDGLPTMVIYDLFQDSKGYMWIGTEAGICKYNGIRPQTYSHPKQKGTSVTRIMEDAQGRIWYKNFSGQLFFIENDSLQLFVMPDNLELSSYFLYQFFDKKLWLNTKKGLCSYDFQNSTWNNFFSPNDTLGLNLLSSLESNEKRLWLQTVENRIYTLAQQKLEYETTTHDPKTLYKSKFFSKDSFLVFNDQEVFFVDYKNLKNNKLEQPFAKVENLLGVFVLSDKRIVITTTNGLLIFEKNKAGQFVQKQHLLPGLQVSSAFGDREGNFWAGTLNNGIFVFPNLDLLYFNPQNSTLPHQHVLQIEKNKAGNFLLGLGNGSVAEFSPYDYSIKNIYKGNNNKDVTEVLPMQHFDSERVLFYNNGLYVADAKTTATIEFYTVIGGHKMAVFQDSFLLVGNNAGSSILNLKPFIGATPFQNTFGWKTYIYTDKNNPEGLYVTPIRQRRTNVIYAAQNDKFWIGYDDSLFCYKQGKIYPLLNQKKASITALDITECAAGLLWVATVGDGIYAFQNDTVVHHFTMQDGLPSNNCYALVYDENALWGGTNKGIFKLDLKNKKVLIYNKLDGLISEEIKDIEIANNQVWAASSKGLISFSKSLHPINQSPPVLRILAIHASDKILNKQEAVDLNYYQNDLKFWIEGINLTSRGNFLYQYRLVGLDSNWVSLSGTSDFILFQTLSAGTYTFELRMKNEDGVLSPTQSFQFSILSPYWQRWWFQLFLYLLVAGVVALVLTLRNISKQKEAAMQSQMSQLRMHALQAQLNPHFVFNAMSAIQSYWLHKQSKEAMIYHSKFAKLMRSIFDFSGSLSIPIQDEIDFLKNYISLEQLRFEDKIEVRFDLADSLQNKAVFLPPLLIQPLIENCFKHAFLHKKEKGLLHIELQQQQNHLYVLIEDDGVGRNAAQEHKNAFLQDPNRLSSMKIVEERLQILTAFYGANKNAAQPIKITDLKNEKGEGIGTKVEVWIPVQIEN